MVSSPGQATPRAVRRLAGRKTRCHTAPHERLSRSRGQLQNSSGRPNGWPLRASASSTPVANQFPRQGTLRRRRRCYYSQGLFKQPDNFAPRLRFRQFTRAPDAAVLHPISLCFSSRPPPTHSSRCQDQGAGRESSPAAAWLLDQPRQSPETRGLKPACMPPDPAIHRQ